MPSTRPRAFLDITIDAGPARRIEIELYNDHTPKTCKNFLTLCTQRAPDLTYRDSPFHRIIDEFIVQGGDVTMGDGTGGKSIYGGDFEDEDLNWRKIDSEGLVCMANRGAKHTNSSQFFITVDNCKELSGKNTVFGRVVKGLDLVKRISQVEVDDGRDFKPTKSVVISHCGELEQERGRKGTSLATSRAEAAIADSSTDESHTGAKRHRLTSSPHSGSRMPSPHTLKSRKRHHRRDSENKRDETFRGRARTSTPLPEGRDSPAEELRRKQRDSSPSRPPKPKDEDAEMGGVNDEVSGKRRRKSLPNHKRCYDQKERRYEQGDRNKGGRHGPYNDERRDGDENEREKDYRPYREHGHHRRSSGYEDGVGTVADPGGVRLKGRGMMKYREQKEPGRL